MFLVTIFGAAWSQNSKWQFSIKCLLMQEFHHQVEAESLSKSRSACNEIRPGSPQENMPPGVYDRLGVDNVCQGHLKN
jgi:hypothetical protein